MHSEFYYAVEHCFDSVKENVSGIHIRMADNSMTDAELVEGEHKKVTVFMNGVEMGTFEPYDAQGYFALFNQKRRPELRTGSTMQDTMLKAICENNNVRYNKA